jgi:hypothetical protein
VVNSFFLVSDLTKVRPRKDWRGFDLISDRLPFGRLWYVEAAAIVIERPRLQRSAWKKFDQK